MKVPCLIWSNVVIRRSGEVERIIEHAVIEVSNTGCLIIRPCFSSGTLKEGSYMYAHPTINKLTSMNLEISAHWFSSSLGKKGQKGYIDHSPVVITAEF